MSWTAADLLATEFPEPRWAVPGIIPEGTTLLAGAPKLGKSWLMLGTSLAVASGGKALSTIPVEQGEALYLSLEDPPRRLQKRLRTMLRGEAAPAGLTFWTVCPRLADGGAERIGIWLDQHPRARLVVVDVLGRVRDRGPTGNGYDHDYNTVAQLKAVADAHNVALVLIHHVRKMSADDWMDLVSGTNGLTAAADSVMVLKRSRGKADGELYLTGRDVEEIKHALTFRADLGLWELTSPVNALPETRARIVGYLQTVAAATPKQIADALKLDHELVKKTCRRMVGSELDTDGAGLYFLSPVSPDQGTLPLTSGFPGGHPTGTPEGDCPPSPDDDSGDSGDSGDSRDRGTAGTGKEGGGEP